MERGAAPRSPQDFAPMDLGVRAARAICDRFGAQVVDYTAEGARGSITLRVPSRKERFYMSAEKYQAALSGAAAVREQTAEVLERAESYRQANQALRASLAEHRQSLMSARMESRRIVGSLGFPDGRSTPGH